MRGPGMRRSPPRRSGWAEIALACLAAPALAQGLPAPLAEAPGDPVRGAAIVSDATRSLCVLCHAGPFGTDFAGTLGPDLTGVGDRLTVPELRQRIVDSRVANPKTIMPPYHSLDGLDRVGARWRGATIFTAQEVEDVVAYLATLKGEAK